MHPSEDMYRIVNKERYSVKTATLLASDEYWDGRNYERRGRNTFLYKTPGGAFFRVNLTLWVNEQDAIEPLSREEAMQLYENLPNHTEGYEEAFNIVVDEATAPMTNGGEGLKEVHVWLTDEMVTWLTGQAQPISATVQSLIKAAMTA